MKTIQLMPKNGKTIKRLDYYDREIIKRYCKNSILTAQINFEENTCKLFSNANGKLVYFADVVKVVNKNLFYLVSDFYVYVNRNPLENEKPYKIKVKAGTEIIVNHENPQQVWVPINNDELILIPRYVLVKNAEIRQSRNLYLSNPDLNMGIGEGQAKYDITLMIHKQAEQCLPVK